MRKINHFGVPTQDSQNGEFFVDGLKVWLTDYTQSPNRIEYLRFEDGSCMPEIVQQIPHIAYEVADIEKAMEGKKVLVSPMEGGENLIIAFIEEEGMPIELMQFTK